MPAGGPNEGFASNYGYGGMPGTTTGMAQGGYAGTGNPGIGAKDKYQQSALAALQAKYGNSPNTAAQAAAKKKAFATKYPGFAPIPKPKPQIPTPATTTPPTDFVPEDLPPGYYDKIIGSPLGPVPQVPGYQSGYDPNAGWTNAYTSMPGGIYGSPVATVRDAITGELGPPDYNNLGSFGGGTKGNYQGGGVKIGGYADGGDIPFGETGLVGDATGDPRTMEFVTAGPGGVRVTPLMPKKHGYPRAQRMAERIFGAGRRPPPEMRGGYPGGVRT